ncbi:PREDICTED: uncharacterized protein LOC105130342 [Populus euphratica]|uniref:Uncharacterized protein LOC105130342 n=1 Tax=Populus euphratica TaxID=75702 RepID=A0AAJ6UJK8_POPEU|nr:PREDICTED: uncharacterized protein LOC105130342 [Populus euphratica]
MGVTENASAHGLKFDVDDMIVKMASQDQTKMLRIKQQLATIDHTPDHPVYPVMVHEAIMDLNEEGGSTKDAISQFIMRKYDVFQVVHVAKLIEQLEKLVEKEEIVFTSENRYTLPAEDSGSPSKLKQGKKQSVQYELDRRSNKLQKVNEGVQFQEDQNAIIEIEDQPESDKAKQTQVAQSEGVEYHNHLQEDQLRVYEEERFEMTTENFSQVVEGQSKVIVEDRYQQPAGVDERHGKEVNIQMRETEATEERSQLQQQELQVTEDQVETERQSKVTEDLHHVEHPENEEIIGEIRPQVPQDLYVDEHYQSEETNIRTIPMQIETRGKEVGVIGEEKALLEQDNKVGNNSTDISHTSEVSAQPVRDKDMIAMPSSSQTSQQLDHVGSSFLLHALKEKCINVWKKLTEAEHELMDVLSCLNSMEVIANIHESEPKALPHSDYVPKDPTQLQQNQQIELPKLKRTAEVQITALQESFQNQKRQALPGNHDFPSKYWSEKIGVSPTQQIMHSQQLEVEKHQDFPSFKGYLQLHDPEKGSKSCSVACSLEPQELNLEQRSEHHSTIVEDLQTPINLENVELQQRLDVPELKKALGKNLSTDGELTPAKDITIDRDQVEPEKPPAFEITEEQFSQERLQGAVPCGDAKKLEPVLVNGQNLELSVKERHIEVETITSEQQRQIKQQIQEKELHPLEQRASKNKSESGAAGATSDQQLHNIEMLQDPKQILVVHESSRLTNQQKKGRGKRKKVEMELPWRELWYRGTKASESNLAHPTDANDVDSDRQWKLDHPIPERPQKRKPKNVEKSSQSVEQELKDQGRKRLLRSQLAPVTSDEVKMLENPKQQELTSAGDSIQTRQKQQLQSRVQCSSQAEEIMDKTMEESQPLPDQNKQESQLAYQQRGKLKPVMDTTKGKILPVDGEDHHKELPLHIQGQRPKAMTSTKLIVREISSSHQSHNEQQPKKRGPGRPPKSLSPASQTVNVPLSPQIQLKQKRLQHDLQKNGQLVLVKGGLQDPNHHQLQKPFHHDLHRTGSNAGHISRRKSLRNAKVMVTTKGKTSNT